MVVGFFSLLGGVTGILVETAIAARLGLSRNSDAFYVAYTLPYIITNLIAATGQFSLVPFFASLEAGQLSEELRRRFSYAVSTVFLGLTAIALAGAASVPWLVRGVAPGFSVQQVELASQLGRWLFLIIIPAGVAEVFRSFLFSQHRFALSSASGFFRNVTVILSIAFTFPRYAEYSIVLGYLAGYLLQFAILGGAIARTFPLRFTLTLRGSGEAFRKLRGAGTAQLTTAVAWQGVVVVERMIASFLPPGTLTALNYGFKIMSSLAELLAGSVGTVALPSLARSAARQEEFEGRRMLRDTLQTSLAMLSPTLVFCLLLNRSIIQLVFERGRFTPEATELMATIFFYYSLSLLHFSFVRILTFYLFARHEIGIFFRFALLLYGVNVALDLFFVGLLRLGAIGIPLGLLVSQILVCGLVYHRDVAEMKQVFNRSLGAFALKNVLAAALTALTVESLDVGLRTSLAAWGNFISLTVLCGTGTLVFVATLAISRAISLSHLAGLWRAAEE
jgi:putative peptidoglycan lipid II flippase